MTRRRLLILKALVHAACLAPLGWLVLRGSGVAPAGLGANPVELVLHTVGKTSLNLLMITLAVTPARHLTGLNWLVRLRRMLGLYVFFYAMLHLSTYVVLDQQLMWQSLLVDVTQRPYITVGFLAIVLMLPLAITSTQAMQRRLGRDWGRLHTLIYPAAVLAVLHFFWQTRADLFEPIVYSLLLTLLLAYRATRWQVRRRRTRETAQSRLSRFDSRRGGAE
jgi:methionine sulfoxide reductase heme-binding subunit